ncbi:MAG: glycosyltransferase [Deltaproteobacteria bacterium]|nr:glycosyltransferase [Deltaproteobacteria bacterium]
MDEKTEALKNAEATRRSQAERFQRAIAVNERLLKESTNELDKLKQALEKLRRASDTCMKNGNLRKTWKKPVFDEQLKELSKICQKEFEGANKGVSQVLSDLNSILASWRWRVGNAVIRAIETFLLRPKGLLATDHMSEILSNLIEKQAVLKEFLSHIFSSLSERQQIFRKLLDDVLEPEKAGSSSFLEFGKSKLPQVSIISSVYNKSESLFDYIESVASQSYKGRIELILVDDVSSDESREIIQCLAREVNKSGKVVVRLIKNWTNLGNCGSRNRGLQASTGDILVVIDADCILNDRFIEEKVLSHNQGYDICLGPMGIESKGRNIRDLLDLLIGNEDALKKEMRLQYPELPVAFINCVTRNFSITKQFLDQVGGSLFDERFSYKRESNLGFGWEDVEMGYRLFNKKAKIWFSNGSISVHKTHKPEFPDYEKAKGSLRNFAKLLEKHPDITKLAPDWTQDTFQKIENWLTKYNHIADANFKKLSHRLSSLKKNARHKANPRTRLRIATYRWHVGHQYDLWKLPYDFSLFYGLSGITANWDYSKRPLPDNASFIRIAPKGETPNLKDYDMAILHFDEFCLRPELSSGRVSQCWGNQFKYMMENFPGPKVAICHGTPLFIGACNEDYSEADVGKVTDTYREEIVQYLGDTLVVCNSYQAQEEWKFKNSIVIWHGFDPLMYPPSQHNEKVISIPGDIKARPHYRGLNFYRSVLRKVHSQFDILADGMPNSVRKPPLNKEYYKTENEWGLANFLNYTHFLSSYGIFFNPTMKSPMPRTRGEALMAGLALVTTSNHDAKSFIDHGYNGFLSDDVVECSLILQELIENKSLRRKVGEKGRELAIDLFHVNRFLTDWQNVVQRVVDKDKFTPHYQVDEGNGWPLMRNNIQSQALKRVLFVCGCAREAGTTRYRVEAAIEALSHYGIMAESISSNQLNRLSDMLYAGKYSIIICHRVAMSDSYLKLVAKCRENRILLAADFDDLLFSNDYALFFDQIKRTPFSEVSLEVESYQKALSVLQYTTVTTLGLREKVQELGVPYVAIVPNTVTNDTLFMSNAAYKERLSRKPRREIAIGYASGSRTHDRDFKIVTSVLKRILQEYQHARLVLMGDIEMPKELLPFKDRVKKMSSVKPVWLPRNLGLLDINICPLEDRPFCNCKSAIKYIEAGLVGVPTVATPTNPLKNAIVHDRNGLLAHTENEWFSCLSRLITDEHFRKKIGKAAREDTLAKYTARNRGKTLVGIYTNWLKEFHTTREPVLDRE